MASDEEKPDFSDVEAGSSSTAPEPEPTEQTYTVASGDSLSKIAHKFYGDAKEWRRIFEANRDVVKDPDRIFPGQKLKIPSA
jgi:nucleoid-associated protein YgaU